MLEIQLGYLYARQRTRTRLASHELDDPTWRHRTTGLLRALVDRLPRR